MTWRPEEFPLSYWGYAAASILASLVPYVKGESFNISSNEGGFIDRGKDLLEVMAEYTEHLSDPERVGVVFGDGAVKPRFYINDPLLAFNVGFDIFVYDIILPNRQLYGGITPEGVINKFRSYASILDRLKESKSLTQDERLTANETITFFRSLRSRAAQRFAMACNF